VRLELVQPIEIGAGGAPEDDVVDAVRAGGPVMSQRTTTHSSVPHT
jgi:hypothetical protein